MIKETNTEFNHHSSLFLKGTFFVCFFPAGYVKYNTWISGVPGLICTFSQNPFNYLGLIFTFSLLKSCLRFYLRIKLFPLILTMFGLSSSNKLLWSQLKKTNPESSAVATPICSLSSSDNSRQHLFVSSQLKLFGGWKRPLNDQLRRCNVSHQCREAVTMTPTGHWCNVANYIYADPPPPMRGKQHAPSAFSNRCQSKEITGEVSLPEWKLKSSVF